MSKTNFQILKVDFILLHTQASVREKISHQDFFFFQDYLLPDVRDRQYLFTFHRRAKKVEWDVNKYNALRDGISKLELDLRRLRDPLRVRATSQDVKDGIGGILGNQLHIGNIKEMLKSKFSSQLVSQMIFCPNQSYTL